MSEVKNILLVGVGGQGIILASKILSTGLIEAGYDVKMSEVHGMAQRGGSVTTQVRYGEKVHSPIIGQGEADLLVSFEEMEAMRWIDYLKPNGKLVINNYRIPSVPILTGEKTYPDGIKELLSEKIETVTVEAMEVADRIGNSKTQNIVMLGALVGALKLDEVNWENVIGELVKPKFVEINVKAFNEGKALAEKLF